MHAKLSVLLLACAIFAACAAAGNGPVGGSPAVIRQPLVAPAAKPVAPRLPGALPVAFSHVPPGVYQVHLHSICSGSQAYHLAYLPNLVVGASHSGQVRVPVSDFGRGWCVIVYADAARSIVLVTQRI